MPEDFEASGWREHEVREGQGSDLLRELARIELQAAVGNDLVKRVSDRLAVYALDSPGNLRLLRHLLTLRRLDENDYTGSEVGGVDTVTLSQESEDSETILCLWHLLNDAETTARYRDYDPRTEGNIRGPARKQLLDEIDRQLVELEIRLGRG